MCTISSRSSRRLTNCASMGAAVDLLLREGRIEEPPGVFRFVQIIVDLP